ncbi:hypothetical protein [Emcibacter sp.]|uniref:hypothetical protein n=1 Tax=Emcibacter sp. TaxID=1979954 RepID=UPI002AA69CD8|nr:hypothetical protein [Emcibacter sp.]
MNSEISFTAVDWTGAKGNRHSSIAVAEISAGESAPREVLPSQGRWSRQAVADWILDLADRGKSALIGFDFSFGLPYADVGAYFPEQPSDYGAAADFWGFVEEKTAAEKDFYAGPLVRDAELEAYFHRPGLKGERYEKRLRLCEKENLAQGFGWSESCFHLIGPSQVGLASLSGMRMLRYLKEKNPEISIWPWDEFNPDGITIIEIYARIFRIMGGQGSLKLRDMSSLNQALAALGSSPVDRGLSDNRLTDHLTDALVTAAGLKAIAHDPACWSPRTATREALRFEGWTFGIK